MWYLVIHDGLVLFTRHTSLYFYQTQTTSIKLRLQTKRGPVQVPHYFTTTSTIILM